MHSLKPFAKSLAIAIGLSIAPASAQDAADDEAKIPAELEPLAFRVGTWETETTMKPGGAWAPPEGAKSTGKETVKWGLDKKIIIGKGKNETNDVEALFMVAYDQLSGVYRFWYFDSTGVIPRTETTGEWDEEKRLLTMEATYPEGTRMTFKTYHKGEDRIEWSGVWKAPDGELLLEMEGVAERQ